MGSEQGANQITEGDVDVNCQFKQSVFRAPPTPTCVIIVPKEQIEIHLAHWNHDFRRRRSGEVDGDRVRRCGHCSDAYQCGKPI